jgi:hypothetical protein
MPTTTNYSWTTPADTDLVKDGAGAIRTLGTAIDTTTKNLNPETTLGDIAYRSSTANVKTRLGLGTAGQVLTVNTGATAPEWKTPVSGTTWTQRLSGTGNRLRQIEYNGTNLYVAAGDAGALYTSPDGITWTSRTSGFGANNIRSIGFGNGLWVAVGENGTLTTSSDGITWTARTANMSTNIIECVVYDNSIWVAVGRGGGTTNTGGITYSTDGLTWTRKSQSLTVGATYGSVLWNGTNWIVGATHSTNNHLYASTPSGTWTAGASGSGAEVQLLAWDGTRHLTQESDIIRYSTSTTLGTTTSYTTPRASTSLYFATSALYNSKLHYALYGYLNVLIPASATYPNIETPILTPLLATGVSGMTFAAVTGMYVNATGYLITDDVGRIWTSF